jgi:hypothetical protein
MYPTQMAAKTPNHHSLAESMGFLQKCGASHDSHAAAPPPHPHQRRAIPLNPFKHEVEQQAQAVLPTDELEQYKMMSPMAEDVWADRYESNALIWWAELVSAPGADGQGLFHCPRSVSLHRTVTFV